MDPAIGNAQHVDNTADFFDPAAINDLVSQKYGPPDEPGHQNKEDTMETTTPEASCKKTSDYRNNGR